MLQTPLAPVLFGLAELGLWVVAFRMLPKDTTATGDWAKIDRNVRLITANVVVVTVNVLAIVAIRVFG